MTNDMIWLAFWIGCLSLSIQYIVWGSVRQILCRQRLFQIRDELWDTAKRLEGFDDPAYIAAREHINALIRAVPMMSVWTAMLMSERSTEWKPIKSSNNELEQAIRESLAACSRQISRYIIWHRTSGWVAMIYYSVFVSGRAVRDAVSRWINSTAPEDMYRVTLHGTAKAHP